MDKIKWFVIGLHLYVFPPDPKVGDIKALNNWQPDKKGFFETLKFRWHTWNWTYRSGNLPTSINEPFHKV